MPNNFARPAAARAAAEIILLRSANLGNNCRFIANNYPDGALKIVTPEEFRGLRGIKHIIRWGTTMSIGAENRDVKVINKASAIKETLDKAAFRKKCADIGVAPKTWMSLDDLCNDPVGAAAVIVRPRNHERSENLHLCKTLAEAEAAVARYGANNYYISEYIAKDREIRVFIVQGKVIIGLEKNPGNKREVSWGCVEEGQLAVMRWSEWPMFAMEAAVKAFNLSKLDFGAVDVMIKGNKAYVLEINTAPEVWTYYGQRLGEAFHHMINVNRERIATTRFGNWKDVAHPTLLN